MLNKLITSIFLLAWCLGQMPTMGFITSDSTAYDGYTLFTPKLFGNTYLIDINGRLVNQWESNYNPAATVYLLENGNLLRATKLSDPQGGSGGFQVLTWEDSLLWEYAQGRQHHDIEPLPNGNVLLIVNDIKTDQEAAAMGRDTLLLGEGLRSLRIMEVAAGDSGSTDLVWEWYAWDHLVQDYDSTRPNFAVVSQHPELINLNFSTDNNANWIHPNSIDYNPELDQIIVSCRTFNELWVIDHSTTTAEAAGHSGGYSNMGGDLLYRWGNPASYGRGDTTDQILYGQHDARWIESGRPGSGNIMYFNNGLGRPAGAWSSVGEIVPPVDSSGHYFLPPDLAFEPHSEFWNYTAPTPTDLYSPKFSGAQRLPNGNTLICSGVGGNIIEVTAAGQLVWQYINPVSNGGPLNQGEAVHHNDLYRVARYGPDYPGLAGKDLTPGSPIEIYLGIDQSFEVDQSRQINLFPNFPNPFNPNTTIRFTLAKSGPVVLTIYALDGRAVKSLLDAKLPAGDHRLVWDGTGNNGQPLGSGVYFYRIDNGVADVTGRLILLK